MQIPFVVPVRTGVVMLAGDATSSGTNEIVTLMGHSEVALRVSLPGHFEFKISWYQGMEGFTGWHGGAWPMPWLPATCMSIRAYAICLLYGCLNLLYFCLRLS